MGPSGWELIHAEEAGSTFFVLAFRPVALLSESQGTMAARVIERIILDTLLRRSRCCVAKKLCTRRIERQLLEGSGM